jgi:hypothetical protein
MILEKEVNKDIGLQLEMSCLFPFLKIGLTIAYFNLSGKTPVLRIALQMYVNGEIISGELNFMILLEISSYPLEFLVFNDLIIFLS